MTKVSFIIPTLGEGEALGSLLSQLCRDFPDAERVVVDGGSRDGTVAIALAGADSVLLSPPGRARQMNLGARGARGSYLCFLHADTRPCFAAEDLQRLLGEEPSWTFCRVRISGRHWMLRVIAGAMNIRSRLTSVATGDQCLILRRDIFESLGGYAQIPLMEDVEICKRLRRDAPPVVHPLTVATSGRRWETHGVLKTILRMWALRFAYWCGVAPQILWEHYYGAAGPGAGRKSR